MKDKRHKAILEIVSAGGVETQEDLGKKLEERGFRVTQATISRDIKELHLIKVQVEGGIYQYAGNESSAVLNTEKMLRIFKETVTMAQGSGNLVVINTISGGANSAAEVVDNLDISGIIGTLAGDNTVFVAVQESQTENIIGKLKAIAR